MNNQKEKLEKLRNKEEQIKSQIKDLEQIQKQKTKQRKHQMNLILGNAINQAINDRAIDLHTIREILNRYVINQKDKDLFKF